VKAGRRSRRGDVPAGCGIVPVCVPFRAGGTWLNSRFAPGCDVMEFFVVCGYYKAFAGGGSMKREIDKFDEEILTALQVDARESVKTIASQVYLSSPAVSARIERLENDGVIIGYHADVNPEFFGYHIKAFINLEVPPVSKETFYPFIRSCPNVVECNCVTGDFSMLIEVLFPRTDDLDLFIGKLQRFGRTHTQIVFSTVVEHRGISCKTASGDTEDLPQ
jgi:Lrp/AsnC family transcriptional regulator, leucine-responsive regulatory protein